MVKNVNSENNSVSELYYHSNQLKCDANLFGLEYRNW